jgi:hypothetical protein
MFVIVKRLFFKIFFYFLKIIFNINENNQQHDGKKRPVPLTEMLNIEK